MIPSLSFFSSYFHFHGKESIMKTFFDDLSLNNPIVTRKNGKNDLQKKLKKSETARNSQKWAFFRALYALVREYGVLVREHGVLVRAFKVLILCLSF